MLVCCVLVVILVCPLSTAYTDTEARERVAALEAQMDIWTSELMRLRDIVDTLRNCEGGTRNSQVESDVETGEGGVLNSTAESYVDSEEGGVRNSTVDIEVGGARNSSVESNVNTAEGGVRNSQDESAESLNVDNKEINLVLREIRKEMLPGGIYRMAIQFWTNGPDDELYVLWTSGELHSSFKVLHSVLLNDIEEGNPGLKETYVDLHQPFDELFVVLKHYNVLYYLQLNSAFGDPEIQTDLDYPLADVQPVPDIVYSRGENASFTVRHGHSTNRPAFMVNAVELDSGEMTGYYSRSDVDYFTVTPQNNSLENKEDVVTVKTSDPTASALMSILEIFRPERGIVHRVEVVRERYLHTPGQIGPFPVGFLAFEVYSDHGTYMSENCEVGNPEVCVFLCNVWGENIATYSSKFRTPSGQTVTLTGTEESTEVPSKHSVYTNIRLDLTKYGYGMGRVICEATNKQGKFVQQTNDVRLFRKAEILRNETEFENLSDYTSQINCTVMGNPAPEVKFEVLYLSEARTELLPPDIEYHVGDKVIASLTLTPKPNKVTCTVEQNVADFRTVDRFLYPVVSLSQG